MKSIASKAALALSAGLALFSTTAATWPSVQTAPSADVAPDPSVLPYAQRFTETPASAERFVDSVGVNAKYESYAYPALVTNELIWSGIKHLRDGAYPSGRFLSDMNHLGQYGIHHSIGLVAGFKTSDLAARLRIAPQNVDYVEPANEADNVRNPNWNQMRSDQRNLWNTVRSNRAYDNIAVLGPSFANPQKHAPLVGPLDGYEDFGVLHNATCDWNPGTTLFGTGIEENTIKIRATTRYKPIWTTETGYSDNRQRGCWLPDSVIAKYLTRTSTERFLHGEPRTYFVFLTDMPYDIVFGHMGLLYSNGSPKPQFLALANLIHLLSDPGSAPRPTSVTYQVVGASSDVHHILLARRDGSYDLLLYREVPCWDHHTHTPIGVGTENVSLILPSNMHNADVYHYASNYTFGRSSLGINGRTHQTSTFGVNDAISVIHFGN